MALWSRSAKEITEAEYHEFYQQIAHDWTDPLGTIHVRSEGTFVYEALLFLPARAPFDLYTYTREAERGVHLYVNRVFIMDECDALMPRCLRFVAGVVDAHDLSLNVSRELLQHDRHIRGVRRRLVKKVLATAKGTARQGRREIPRLPRRLRARPEGRPARGRRQPRSPARSAAARLHPRHRRTDHATRLPRADEAGAEPATRQRRRSPVPSSRAPNCSTASPCSPKAARSTTPPASAG